MNTQLNLLAIILLMTISCSVSKKNNPVSSDDIKSNSAHYEVARLKSPGLIIDGNWDKKQWKKVQEIPISRFMGEIPAFKPVAKGKMMYDEENLYLIFRVEDRHVRIQTKNFNGPVSGDACVEFFFSPDNNFPMKYFNLEINAGGIPLMGYHTDGRKEFKMLQPEELKMLEIAHSLPESLDKEIAEPVTWTVECKIPLDLLKNYASITEPEKGATWRANFYKTSSRSSNPHYITWATVNNPKPDFHLPQFFGTLIFK